MKVFNLCCPHSHGFEGWFGSEEDFRKQLDAGLVECPMCGANEIRRLPSAPRLNLSGSRAPTAAESKGAGAETEASKPTGEAMPAEMLHVAHAAWLQMVRKVMANTEDVGPRFSEEARRIHYGEAEQRGIRGQATPEEHAALADEGIEVMALPLPAALKGPVH